MSSFRLDQLLDAVTSTRVVVGALWLGLVGLTIGLLVMMRTRWGQYHQVRKCLILSLIAHLLFVGYATTVQIVASAPIPPLEEVQLRLEDEPWPDPSDSAGGPRAKKPWESFVHPTPVRPEPPLLARADPADPPVRPRQVRPEPVPVADPPSLEPLETIDPEVPEPEVLAPEPAQAEPAGSPPEPIASPSPQRREEGPTRLPAPPAPDRRAAADSAYLEPVRRTRPGVPSALLPEPAPVPRLREPASGPEPDDALAGWTDRPTRPSQGAPTPWTDPTPADTDAASQPDTPTAPGPPGNPLRHLRPPALAVASRGAAPHPATGAPARPRLQTPLLPLRAPSQDDDQLPAVYRLRVAEDREERAQQHGATRESEEAVRRALQWLARNQEPEGNWSAARHGAGRELLVAGRNRYRAGIHADTGLTGLALLAFLAAGHTHQRGAYQATVQRGLDYLLRTQARDGSLGGQASTYAFMYCHGMATFALCEACGMTKDPALEEPMRRAIAYTLAAQNPTTGGWRYSPGDPGDTSQVGWQVLALKSAELAGLPFPVQTRNGAIRFLNSVAYGNLGGLSAYRPGERVSRAMTAEALACRHFLGMAHDHPAGYEAGDYLLEELPGQGPVNLYYWYYGTLVMYHLAGDYWTRWNQALQETLISKQVQHGPLAGSWDPDTVWGGYGGRVYSTALATLCLEVYYRFLPRYLQVAAEPAKAERPQAAVQ